MILGDSIKVMQMTKYMNTPEAPLEIRERYLNPDVIIFNHKPWFLNLTSPKIKLFASKFNLSSVFSSSFITELRKLANCIFTETLIDGEVVKICDYNINYDTLQMIDSCVKFTEINNSEDFLSRGGVNDCIQAAFFLVTILRVHGIPCRPVWQRNCNIPDENRLLGTVTDKLIVPASVPFNYNGIFVALPHSPYRPPLCGTWSMHMWVEFYALGEWYVIVPVPAPVHSEFLDGMRVFGPVLRDAVRHEIQRDDLVSFSTIPRTVSIPDLWFIREMIRDKISSFYPVIVNGMSISIPVNITMASCIGDPFRKIKIQTITGNITSEYIGFGGVLRKCISHPFRLFIIENECHLIRQTNSRTSIFVYASQKCAEGSRIIGGLFMQFPPDRINLSKVFEKFDRLHIIFQVAGRSLYHVDEIKP